MLLLIINKNLTHYDLCLTKKCYSNFNLQITAKLRFNSSLSSNNYIHKSQFPQVSKAHFQPELLQSSD